MISLFAGGVVLSRDDVRALIGAAGQQLSGVQQRAADTAERVADVTARAFWALFSVMLLSLMSAVLGSITGVARRQRELSARADTLPAGSGDMSHNEAAYS